jgi:hypothetical protein
MKGSCTVDEGKKCGIWSRKEELGLLIYVASIHCEAHGCGKSSSISATEVKESNLFWVEFSSFIAIEKE